MIDSVNLKLIKQRIYVYCPRSHLAGIKDSLTSIRDVSKNKLR